MRVLRKHKGAIEWTLVDIKGISPSTCMHKILLEEEHKPTMEHQGRLNSVMKDVVRKEILKWLDARIIYPILDNLWVSPVQVVPKKGGMMVAKNKQNEIIPTRMVTGWRICIDYRKLNKAIRIIFLYPSSIKCWIVWRDMSITVSLMVIQVIIK